MPNQRIVSLIASATEIVCALDFERELVGRSHECDFPEWVKRLPVCTAPKFNTEGSSNEIDQCVKAALSENLPPGQRALSVYSVHVDKLRQLQPQFIITQSQCEVCAVSLRDVEYAVSELVDSRPRIISLEPNTLADVWKDIKRVAIALGVHARGEELVERLKKRMAIISEISRSVNESPTVACIEWIDPLMAAGNWMPELIEMAAGKNLFGEAGKHSPWMTWQELCEKDPQVIIVSPCGFDLRRTCKEMYALTQKREWPQLHAVRNRRVYLTDGNQYMNRPGPRLVKSLEILAEIFHPTVFDFGHEGLGWKRL